MKLNFILFVNSRYENTNAFTRNRLQAPRVALCRQTLELL